MVTLLKITTKLLLCFSLIIALFIGIFYISSQTKNKIEMNSLLINTQIETTENDFDRIMQINALKIQVNRMVETVLSLGYITDLAKQQQIYDTFNQQLSKIKKQTENLNLLQEVQSIIEKIKFNVDDVFMYKQAELDQIKILNDEKDTVKANKEKIRSIEADVKKYLKIRNWQLDEFQIAVNEIDKSQPSKAIREKINGLLVSFSFSLFELEKIWRQTLSNKPYALDMLYDIPLTTREILRNTQESLSLNKQLQNKITTILNDTVKDFDFRNSSNQILFIEAFQLYGKSIEEVSGLLKESREIVVDNIFLSDDIEYKEEGVKMTKNCSLNIINQDLIMNVEELTALLNNFYSTEEKNLKISLSKIKNVNH